MCLAQELRDKWCRLGEEDPEEQAKVLKDSGLTEEQVQEAFDSFDDALATLDALNNQEEK